MNIPRFACVCVFAKNNVKQIQWIHTYYCISNSHTIASSTISYFIRFRHCLCIHGNRCFVSPYHDLSTVPFARFDDSCSCERIIRMYFVQLHLSNFFSFLFFRSSSVLCSLCRTAALRFAELFRVYVNRTALIYTRRLSIEDTRN